MLKSGLKIGLGLALAYIAVVIGFETWLGISQPSSRRSLVITTSAQDGSKNARVLSALETDGRLYVSANHWPRAWYRQALENPAIEVEYLGRRGPYQAVAISGQEVLEVAAQHPHSLMFRILTGFPPRFFVRLDPR